jgi:hypothetical protein
VARSSKFLAIGVSEWVRCAIFPLTADFVSARQVSFLAPGDQVIFFVSQKNFFYDSTVVRGVEQVEGSTSMPRWLWLVARRESCGKEQVL